MKPTLVTSVPRSAHLLFVLKEAQKAFEEGDFQKGLDNLCHSVFTAATDGAGRLSHTELIYELRKIAGFGYDPGQAA